ncbi:ATPases involved in chromosome partitioning [Gordonia terrae C-6]|uniref:non-specific protein-tyrosine kinase n=1 Tax=Gordonia terrae C-6 TaxID=1316928 RepID=R7Y679_9ACTN|nr:ATPases involved in chromosome partitioning [Gordonia terrae C-6]
MFGRSRLGTRIRDEGDLDDAIGVHSLGVVASDGAFADRSLIDFRAGGSSTAEQFRKIRTNLTFANVDNSVRKILISSPSQSEGKTTTSLNLAASLAELGKSVVLVDADLRRPAVASRLQAVSPDIGLTDYLRGSAPVGDVLQRSGVGGFDVLAAGALPPNPAELLGSRRTGQLLDELCELYDYVLVDSPPVLPVTDAVVVSQWVDGGIIVVRAGGTTRQELVASLAQLHASRVSILGVVLNGVNLKARDNRYGYYAQASREGVTA